MVHIVRRSLLALAVLSFASLGLACSSEDDVRGWAERLDGLGVEHGPVETAPYGWAVTARDPDGIAVEVFCPKVAAD